MYIVMSLQKLVIALLGVLLAAVVVAVILLMPEGRTQEVFRSDTADEPRIMVIDAGHGGEDGGAVSSDLIESYINLDIAQRLELMAELFGVHTVMTRSNDHIEYPDSANTTKERKTFDQKSRVELINETPNAILISIHQNKYPNSRPRGAQVFYSKNEGSMELAEIVQEKMTTALYPENRRVAAQISDRIYIMKKVDCPAILVECGFISNPEEAALLIDPAYQVKVSSVMLVSYLQYISQ